MGTRSITRVHTGTGDKLINMYRQFDGYPTGHGQELFDFLNGFEIVKGYSGSEGPKAANGADCLAAQLVTHFKLSQARHGGKLIGGFYIKPVDATDCGQDYEYIVTVTQPDWNAPPDTKGSIGIKVISYGETKFDGSVEDFGVFCSKEDEDE